MNYVIKINLNIVHCSKKCLEISYLNGVPLMSV